MINETKPPSSNEGDFDPNSPHCSCFFKELWQSSINNIEAKFAQEERCLNSLQGHEDSSLANAGAAMIEYGVDSQQLAQLLALLRRNRTRHEALLELWRNQTRRLKQLKRRLEGEWAVHR